MIRQFEDKNSAISYDDNTSVRNLVFDKIVKWYQERGCYIGEVVMQDDDCNILASSVLSDIVDNIIKFKVTYKESL